MAALPLFCPDFANMGRSTPVIRPYFPKISSKCSRRTFLVNPETMTTRQAGPRPAGWGSLESLDIRGGGIDRFRDRAGERDRDLERESDRIDALDLDRFRPAERLRLWLFAAPFPSRPRDTDRSMRTSTSAR